MLFDGKIIIKMEKYLLLWENYFSNKEYIMIVEKMAGKSFISDATILLRWEMYYYAGTCNIVTEDILIC